jgi:hypothetical protein
MPGASKLYQGREANPVNLPDKSFAGFPHSIRVGSLSIPRVLDGFRVGLDWKPLTSRDQYSSCAPQTQYPKQRPPPAYAALRS